MMVAALAYKVLGANQQSCHGGGGRWTKNQWRTVQGDLIPCANGIHYCRRDQLVRWLGPTIWVFEDGAPDETIDAGDKMVTWRGRVVERCELWNETTARLFAADCAEQVVHLIPESHRDPFTATIGAARGFARGEVSDQELAAAWDAAWDAAWAAGAAAGKAAEAAGDAAEAAAWDAAWAAGAAARAAAWAAGDATRKAAEAAGDAAEAAAWDAARAAGAAAGAAARAAGAAAWDAAWAAEAATRAAQTDLLFDYLEGRRS